MENRKFSLEKPVWMMRDAGLHSYTQSQQCVGVYVCIKSIDLNPILSMPLMDGNRMGVEMLLLCQCKC